MPRNSSGTYSLPNTPVVSGTPISSTDENATRSDVATEMTDSLSRSGKGGMNAPLRVPDGTVSAPSLSFTNETGTGFFRSAANDIKLAIGGTALMRWLSGIVQFTTGVLRSEVADGATARAFVLDTTTLYSTSGVAILGIKNNGTEVAAVNQNGKGFFVGLDAGGAGINNLLDPGSAQDAATKAYVDAATPLSARSGTVNATITTTSYADVPSLAATLVTRGRSVAVFLGAGPVGGGPSLITTNVGGNVTNSLRVTRDGTAITGDIVLSAFAGDTDAEIPSPGFLCLDAAPAAGSHVYKIQWKVNANSTALSNVELSVIELG